jgi:hypothetical protein
LSEPYDEEPQGLPCLLSEEVTDLLVGKALPGVFGAIVAATVVIN